MTNPEAPPGRTTDQVGALSEHLDEVALELDQAGGWTLFLDLDGTLAPIVARPDEARVPDSTVAILRRLALCPEGKVAIVSGRALDDARALVGLDSIYYAGNHGLEIAGPDGVRFDEPIALALRARLDERIAALARRLSTVPGVEVEPKGLTASVHYRRVDPDRWPAVAAAVVALVPPDDPDFAARGGKRVHEIRPRVAWGKGSACLWIARHLGRAAELPIFLGDDLTDEDAFLALAPRGLTGRVGSFSHTHARYRLVDTAEVAAFLEWLAGRSLR